jgi:hypothetical protein
MPLTGTAKKQANARAASKRVAQLQAAAKRDGFETTSAALTAWIHDEYYLTKRTRTRKSAAQAERME